VQHISANQPYTAGLPDYLKGKTVYFTVDFNNTTGNKIGSENGKFALSANNYNALYTAPTNYFFILSPGQAESIQPLAAGNVLVNSVASPQPGGLIAALQTVVSRPLSLPELSGPCNQGQGSTLEIMNTQGVMLQFEKQLPFSVFPNGKDLRLKGKPLNTVMANPEPLVLAVLPTKSPGSCTKG